MLIVERAGRDVKVMRKRPVSGEEWQSCMKRYNGMSSIMSQEQLRDDYCDKARRQLKEAVATRHRKPCEAYNEDGTPKEGAASSLPPYPSSADSTGGNSISKDAQDQSADNSAGPALLNFSNFLKSEPDSGWESRKRVRRGFEHQLADCIRSRYPEARFVSQLQELERKVDAISTRKRMQVEESLRHPGTCTRTLQLVMWNTHENQDSAGKSIDEEADLGGGQASCSAEGSAGSGGGKPSWTLFITGRVVDANGEEITGEGQATLASLLERVFIQLPAHLYPDSHAIEWNRWDGVCKGLKEEQAASGGNATGFSIKREGAEECKVRVMLHCASNPKRFSLSGNPELGELLGFESGSWSQLLVAFWAYVQEHSLHSDDDVSPPPLLISPPFAQLFLLAIACSQVCMIVKGGETRLWPQCKWRRPPVLLSG
jgi:SWI/SNF-related matrix-associated actin-dependent regulator of chromatin subfamily D